MLIYINDKEVEELNDDSNNAIAYIHDREERQPNGRCEYAYIQEYEYNYKDESEEKSTQYEIEYDIDDFLI